MNEYQFRQFERNRYFPGKTLTVRDFKAEQEYYNQKRHMLNRLAYGTGVLWGLQVDVDNTGENVTINPGMALDCFGREIIISKPVTMRISDIEDAPTGGIAADKEVDLCVEYQDNEQEPLKAADKLDSCCTESFEYNRIKEGCKFKIKQDIKTEESRLESLFTNTNLFYNDGEISVTYTIPLCVNPNELFPVRITVERKVKKAYSIVINPSIVGKNLYFNNDESKTITVNISSTDSNMVFNTEFYMRTQATLDNLTSTKEEYINIAISVKYLESNKESSSSCAAKVKIIQTSVSDEVVSSFFGIKANMVIAAGDESVKIASLKLSKYKSLLGYRISQVGNPGFGGYVYNNDTLYELLRILETRFNNQKYPLEIKKTSASVDRPDPGSPPSARVSYNQLEKHLGFDFSIPKEMATGIVCFEVESEILKAGDNGITEIIDPGLGKGPVYVNVEWEQCRYREVVLPKDSVVFGAYPNSTDGTFKIWYRVIRDFERIENSKRKIIHTLHFRWWAFTNVHDKGESMARRFVITPKHKRIKITEGESYTLHFKDLTAKFKGGTVNSADIFWKALPHKPSRLIPDVDIIDNNRISFHANTKPLSFVLKGTYKKENVYDKIVVTVINEFYSKGNEI